MAHALPRAVAIALANASITALERSRPAGLFSVVQGLLQSRPMGVEGEHIVAHCGVFANYYTGKVNRIHSELGAGLNVQASILSSFMG